MLYICSTLKLWFQVFEEIYDIGSCVSEIKSTKVTFVTIKQVRQVTDNDLGNIEVAYIV